MRILEGFREAVWHIEAPFLNEQWGDTERNMQAARQRGARVILGGDWGDEVLFTEPYLIDLVRRLKWVTVRNHLKEFGRWVTDAGPNWFYRVFLVDMVRYHIPERLVPLLRRLRCTKDGPWYSQAFRRRARKGHRRCPVTSNRFSTAYARSTYEGIRIGHYVFSMEWCNKVATMHGLEMAFPYLDRDLVQFMIGIPGEVHAHNGVPKALLREAMRGIVPELILRRKWKADFTHRVNEGVAYEYPKMVDCLESGRRATELGYLKRAGLKEKLASLRAGLKRPDAEAAWLLGDFVSLEMWLKRFF